MIQVGIFILGQYKFAGSVIFSPSLHTFERTFTKQRRNLHDDLVKQRNVPTLKFSTEYHVTGTLKLPYGDIIEPFEAWYSAKEKMSRIDYYGGKFDCVQLTLNSSNASYFQRFPIGQNIFNFLNDLRKLLLFAALNS